MSKKEILGDDWSDYDDRKKKKGDANFFACSEIWEENFLVDKILKFHDELSEDEIRTAISDCCDKDMGNNPREEFVGCVMDRLGID